MLLQEAFRLTLAERFADFVCRFIFSKPTHILVANSAFDPFDRQKNMQLSNIAHAGSYKYM